MLYDGNYATAKQKRGQSYLRSNFVWMCIRTVRKPSLPLILPVQHHFDDGRGGWPGWCGRVELLPHRPHKSDGTTVNVKITLGGNRLVIVEEGEYRRKRE